MLRKTLTILSLIGLLLSVGLWGVSHIGVGLVAFPHTLGAVGGFVFYSHRLEEFDQPTYERELATFGFSWLRLGDGFYVVSKNPPRYPMEWWFQNRSVTWSNRMSTGVRLPVWMPTAMLGGLLTWTYSPIHRRRKRKKLGLCVKCGYDLRGSKERCPECGQEFETT